MRAVAQSTLLVLATLLSSATAVNDGYELTQVHIMTRHGEQTHPIAGGYVPVLTYLGQKQMYDLGRAMRARYAKRLQLSSLETAFVDMRSTEEEPALVSAASLGLGMFQLESRVGALLRSRVYPPRTAAPRPEHWRSQCPQPLAPPNAPPALPPHTLSLAFALFFSQVLTSPTSRRRRTFSTTSSTSTSQRLMRVS